MTTAMIRMPRVHPVNVQAPPMIGPRIAIAKRPATRDTALLTAENEGGESDEVGHDDPLLPAQTPAEFFGDRGDRDVHDRAVEKRHEGRHGDQ